MTRLCPKCNKEKDPSQFFKARKRPDGLRLYCKECDRAYYKEYSRIRGNKRFEDFEGIKRFGIIIPMSQANRNFVNEWAKRENITPTQLLYEEFANLIFKEKIRQENEFREKVANSGMPPEPIHVGRKPFKLRLPLSEE